MVERIVDVQAFGIEDVQLALRRLGDGGTIARTVGPALGRAAAVVRVAAKRRNFVFTDRTGRLRRSIRSRRVPAVYAGRRYRSGRAAVFAGGQGARQAYLVEAGHGGPRPARPYPYLSRALRENTGLIQTAFQTSIAERWPRIAGQIAAKQMRRFSLRR